MNKQKNIVKAGTVESLTYDVVNGAVIATSAFGVIAMITLATSLWRGENFDNASKIGGTAFATSIISSQLSKVGLNSVLVANPEVIMTFMGPKASAVLINSFRNGSNIYGTAAMKSAAKLLRGNVITAGVTVIVLSSFDVANIFNGRISGKQLFKNLTNTATTVAVGTGGWLVGAAAGSAIFPRVGTIVGGIIGLVTAGTLSSKASDKLLSNFIEEDADEMVKVIKYVFSNLAKEYLLSEKEAEKSVDSLKDKLDGKILKNMYSSENYDVFANQLLRPIIEKEISKRKKIHILSQELMIDNLKNVLEELYLIGITVWDLS